MREELKYAALYGPEVIPYYRKKIKSRLREFAHSDVEYLLKRVKHEEWDWNSSLGDTIKEKCESLLLKMFKLTNQQSCIKVNTDLVFTSPELASIFDYSCAGFWPEPWDNAKKDVYKVTKMYNRWTLYYDMLMPKNLMLLTRKSLDAGVAIKVTNIVI